MLDEHFQSTLRTRSLELPRPTRTQLPRPTHTYICEDAYGSIRPVEPAHDAPMTRWMRLAAASVAANDAEKARQQ